MIDETMKEAMLKGMEQKVHRWLIRRLVGADGLKHMTYENNDLSYVDISIDDYPEAIRITIKAEWIKREDATE